MAKLLLLSIIIATIALPVRAAKSKQPRAGLKKALLQMAIFNVFYLGGLLYLYGRL
jgi:hypothetical protein